MAASPQSPSCELDFCFQGNCVILRPQSQAYACARHILRLAARSITASGNSANLHLLSETCVEIFFRANNNKR